MTRSIAFSSLAELAQGLRQKQYTSVEVTRCFLDRIARLDGTAHAYIAVFEEAALRQAQAADSQRSSGLPLPPLHGLPIAIKDLCEIEGQVTTAGAAAWRARRSETTATAVERLQAQGMILLGKLHMSEFAFSGWGANQPMGTPRNPWDWRGEHRVPGGSSSGSGVAVAAGLAPAALGSDTGGSVRIPAALNGVTGLKPTYGLVSGYGCIALSTSMDCLGPLTRSAEDAALLARALAGTDPRDATTRFQPWNWSAAMPPDSALRLKIGVMAPGQYPWPVDPAVQRATDEAIAVFRSIGAYIDYVELPFDLPGLYRNWSTITSAEAYRQHASYIHDAELPFDPWVRQRVIAGQAVTGSAYIAAQEHRARTIAAFDGWMRRYDLLLTPTVPMAACTLQEVDEAATPLGTLTRWVNYLGTCALSLPAGFSAQGLPVGVQLVARPWQEALLLWAGQAFQQQTDWHRHMPQGL
ncbi:amidase [Bordetella sp. BOR01]|uniref:amidase n=1 Tax=Bordetella sp. BOR01 TaxID=2854779 RepID=UPI001C457B08|nr:amidase [Bordetella sp. BOR01]MBV7481445.1 amidase [Bordetella sp. BOR01]